MLQGRRNGAWIKARAVYLASLAQRSERRKKLEQTKSNVWMERTTSWATEYIHKFMTYFFSSLSFSLSVISEARNYILRPLSPRVLVTQGPSLLLYLAVSTTRQWIFISGGCIPRSEFCPKKFLRIRARGKRAAGGGGGGLYSRKSTGCVTRLHINLTWFHLNPGGAERCPDFLICPSKYNDFSTR